MSVCFSSFLCCTESLLLYFHLNNFFFILCLYDFDTFLSAYIEQSCDSSLHVVFCKFNQALCLRWMPSRILELHISKSVELTGVNSSKRHQFRITLLHMYFIMCNKCL